MRVSSLLKSNKTSTPSPFPPNQTALFKSLHQHQTQSPSFLTPTHLNTLLNKTHQTKNIKHATQLHTQIITHNFLPLSFLFNNLLNLYSICGHLTQALTLFSTTHGHSKNIITWTSLITRFSYSNQPFKALTFFKKMLGTGLYPNHFTFSTVLPACADTLVLVHGEQVHSLVWKCGVGLNCFVGSALVSMYGKCGDMVLAGKVFDEMPERSLASWNSMIVGFMQNKVYDRAVGLLRDVIRERSEVGPDQVSFSSVLSVCACMVDADMGRQVHGVVVKHGLVSVAYVKNSLMDMYSRCGLFEDSVKLFQTIEERDVVAWNVMVMGCVHNGKFEKACNYFCTMINEGVQPDEASFSSSLHAAASMALVQGTLVHNQIIKTGFETNVCVARSLITMYSKCGKLVDAYRVFDESENRDVLHWTTMISACQQHGSVNKAIELFEDMLGKGITPDYVTFISVLSACSHTGCVDKGFAYFNSMREKHNMNPGPEHFACMVDLLGRAGRLSEAKSFVESMPIEPNASIWGALLAACRIYGNVEIGREAAEKLIEIQPDNSGNYLLLCSMYEHCGMLKEAKDVRRLMGSKRIRKEIECSWIDYKNKTFVFTANDRSHPRTSEILDLLKNLEEMIKKGYVAHYAIDKVYEDIEQNLRPLELA